jgi:hypothetical protein
VTVEYVFAAVLALSRQSSQSCSWLEPGMQYMSRTPTQNPNWCVINRSNARSPVRLEFLHGSRLFMGPGIEPCNDSGRTPTS